MLLIGWLIFFWEKIFMGISTEDRLLEENKKLRNIIQEAFDEGWDNCYDYVNSFSTNNQDASWYESKTYKILEGWIDYEA